MEWEVRTGDALTVLRTLEPESVQCVVTSPPYWGLRDYGMDGQLGLEPTPALYLAALVGVFREVHRVLRSDGTLWLNLGDVYSARAGQGEHDDTMMLNRSKRIPRGMGRWGMGSRLVEGLKPKDLVMLPARAALALQADGWWLRSDIIWHKSNPMPESVTDRPARAHEYLFLLTRSERYFYDHEAVRRPDAGQDHRRGLVEPVYGHVPGQGPHVGLRTTDGRNGKGANLRSVWTVATEPFPQAHFATFPTALVEPCVKAGSRPNDLVLDPFAGSGTVGVVAVQHGRRFLGIDLNPVYVEMAERRIHNEAGLFSLAQDGGYAHE